MPLYDVEGAAGAGRSLENESVVGTFTIDFETLTQMGLVGARLAGIRVRGDSMEPTLFDDDWVFIDLNDTNFAQAGVFLVWVSGELRIKRLQRLAGGAMLLISDNSYYEKEMIAPDRMQEVHVMGRVRTRMGEIA
ncbi:S24 family peptidase [Salinicola acroporae]|uniref:S24 family peptidase n=1 Tax=Salinicola acroporae TaxID=1541440 RepID=UPI001F0B953B|nr:S24 family peptidase [Salinicola acroporae]